EDSNPRGPVVEYTNIILKEIGHPSPPRMAYIFDK
ncbi:PipA/GogA/GtgA family type III secretion system effector, partial [Salmonella enterica subsp. enterica serovar Saintpaul]